MKCRRISGPTGCSSTRQPHCLHGLAEAQHSEHMHEIVGEYVQTHLRTYIGQPLRQEVRVAHSMLERSEDMFGGSPAHGHRIGRLVQRTLNCFQHRLMLSPTYPSLVAGRWSLGVVTSKYLRSSSLDFSSAFSQELVSVLRVERSN